MKLERAVRRIERGMAYIFLALLVIFAVLEIGTRLRKDNDHGMDRYFHPYIMLGGFHKGGYFESRRDLDPNEIPEAFGYKPGGWLGVPVFDPNTPVHSITERGRFLYRDRAALADARDGLPKIFIIGGSVAYGEGASRPEKRWYVDMEKDLDSARKKQWVHVISAANHSWVSTQERIDMDLFVLPKHPSMIIDVTGFNDANTDASATRPGDPYGMSVWYKHYSSPFYGFLQDVSKYSYFLKRFMLQDLYSPLAAMNRPDTPEIEARSVANVLLDNVAWMNRRCKLEHLPCLFLLQPFRDLSRMHRKLPLVDNDQRMLADYNEILKEMKRTHSPLIDFTHVFDDPKEPLHFIDPAHFNDRGHEIFGQAIADMVLKSGKMK